MRRLAEEQIKLAEAQRKTEEKVEQLLVEEVRSELAEAQRRTRGEGRAA